MGLCWDELLAVREVGVNILACKGARIVWEENLVLATPVARVLFLAAPPKTLV